MKGANIRKSIRITFEEAVFGCKKELEVILKDPCTTCGGTGAKPGTSPETCPKCGGKGQVVYTSQSFFGTVQNVQTCPNCGGSGKVIKEKCTSCSGTGYTSSKKKIEVTILQELTTDRVYVFAKRRAGYKRRSERRSSGRGERIQTSDLPTSGYAHFLNSADFICAGSARWRCEDPDCGRSGNLQC